MDTNTLIDLQLTVGECSALGQLINLAVQARGMEVAEVAVALSKKLVTAIKAASTDNPVA